MPRKVAPTAGQIDDIKLVRTSVLCNGDLATYAPQARRGSVAFMGKSHIPSSATTARAGHAARHYVRRLPADLSSRIEDELYALNLLQLTRDYPLGPHCLRYPLDFLLDSLPDEVRRSVVIPLDPATSDALEVKLFGAEEAAFAEALDYLQQQPRRPKTPQQQRRRRLLADGVVEDEEDEEHDAGEEDDDEDEDGDKYPEFFRDVRDHGEYVFWPVDTGDHQWLLCVLHLRRSPATCFRRAAYDQVTDFAVVDPEWGGDNDCGSAGGGDIRAQSQDRVKRVTERLVKIFRRGGIEIDPPRTQRQLWAAPSTICPVPVPVQTAAAAVPAIGCRNGGNALSPQPPSPPSPSSISFFLRAGSPACGAAGYDDERFFEGTSGWVDADAVRHEMVGMALQRCNAALGYACRYYLAPIDTLVLVGDIDGENGDDDGNGNENGSGNGDGKGTRTVQPDALRPSRVGKRLFAPDFLGLEDGDGRGNKQSAAAGARARHASGRRRSYGAGGRGRSPNVVVAAASAAALACRPEEPETPRNNMRSIHSIAINQQPPKRTARDADIGNEDEEDDDDRGELGNGNSSTHQIKRARVSE
ncbi:hypothetical protein PG999_003227 [Apiospora kogelbergensis]|uniref:Uncharacterized protein n=1 Tax=Apiospora kogelbergensis TaxID=1337665 RepID=A0AAW0R306_9PEZI